MSRPRKFSPVTPAFFAVMLLGTSLSHSPDAQAQSTSGASYGSGLQQIAAPEIPTSSPVASRPAATTDPAAQPASTTTTTTTTTTPATTQTTPADTTTTSSTPVTTAPAATAPVATAPAGPAAPTLSAPSTGAPPALPPGAATTMPPQPAAAKNKVAEKPAAQSASAAPEKKPVMPQVMPQQIYDSKGQPYGTKYYKETARNITIALQRQPELKPEQFFIHLAADAVSGCPKLSNLPHDVKFEDDKLLISIQPFTVDMRHLPDAPQYACDQHVRSPSADIVLNRDDLLAKGIHQIVFNAGVSEPYDVEIDKMHIRLQPVPLRGISPHFRAAKINNVSNSLAHWFYPANTVVLYLQGNEQMKDIAAPLADFARNLGLQPLRQHWPDFQSPLVLQAYAYYVDKGGHLTRDPGINNGIVAGTITVNKKVYGLEKDEIQPKNLTVFAKTPGTYE